MTQLVLFRPEDLQVRPTLEARLRGLAERSLARRPRSVLEARAAEEFAAMDRLRARGDDLARRFRLRPHRLEAESEGTHQHYGICYRDGLIRIRLRHAVTGKLLKDSSLVDTLCHELAHLRHFDHSPRFWRFYRTILDEARKLGYYRPGPDAGKPRQASLFDAGPSRNGTIA